jgi:hypothetical protein
VNLPQDIATETQRHRDGEKMTQVYALLFLCVCGVSVANSKSEQDFSTRFGLKSVIISPEPRDGFLKFKAS